METIPWVLIVACGTGFLAMTLLLAVMLDGVLYRLHEKQVRHRAGIYHDARTQLFDKGIPVLLPLARRIMSIKKVNEYVMRISGAWRIHGYQTNLDAVMTLLIGGIVGITALVIAISGSVVCGCVIGIAVVMGLGMWSTRQIEAEGARLREALPEALQSMKACFQVGYSLPQTIREVQKSTPGALGQLFGEVASILETGGTIDDALRVLKERGSQSELVFLAAALDIQHRTGSSMQQVLEVARQSVVDEIELKRALRTQTAQAKLSAQIVTLMPFVLIGIFSLVSPGFMDPFFDSTAGLVLLLIAIAMQVAGISLVRKMLNVEVD